jgi:sulfur relay (sulfurtransferase) DsrF/TusC family protein
MSRECSPSLGMIVNTPPYGNRTARDSIDFALAAAAMDFELRVYFPGLAILQLAAERNASAAMLPGGYRAWAALPDLSAARIFVEQQWQVFCQARELDLVMPVEALSAAGMKQSWRGCDHVIVL